VTAISLRGGPQRLLKAAGLESAGDYVEAAYWYRLAANDGEAKAFTNLGTLMVRGQGSTNPIPRLPRCCGCPRRLAANPWRCST
jgi:TPR repeat protein